MNETTEKILLLPRFTAFAGNGPYYTAPINIRAYSRADITAWASLGFGTSRSTIQVSVEESPDLDSWFALGGLIGSTPESEETTRVPSSPATFRFDWLRLRVELTGTDTMGNAPVLTAWAVGNFVRRET